MGPNWGWGWCMLGAETLSCSGTSVSGAVSLKVQLRPQEAGEASHTFCSRGGQAVLPRGLPQLQGGEELKPLPSQLW